MAEIILRGRITSEGRIELIDPLPEDADQSQEVSIILRQKTKIYETVNEYGDRAIVDEDMGTETPVETMANVDFLNSGLFGLWSDRRDEIGDSAEWIRKLRGETQQRNDLWRGRNLS
jgi:hypothetical protein